MQNINIKNETISLGLRANWVQFSLLVLVNAFVGGMIGLERTVLPLIAEQRFGIASKSAILSFIVSFGIVKAITNLISGKYADKVGRKKLLILGWLAGLPVPLMLIWAPSWEFVTLANLFLGINQGLCWSTTVIMKIDLVGPKRRGFAMGLNEFAGYGAVAMAAFASGYLASRYGLWPVPFYLGIVFVVLGLLLTIVAVRDTAQHVQVEAQNQRKSEEQLSFKKVFALTSYRDARLFSCSQAGLVNNLNDGMAWGLFPLFFATISLDIKQIGILAATYPAVWGISQIVTGALSDKLGRKWMIASGMWIQAAGIGLIVLAPSLVKVDSTIYLLWIVAGALLGIGTALVYPTLLAAIGDVAHPQWRASAVGVYRMWRDLGYAFGALLAGVVADFFGIAWAITIVGIITFLSGVVVAIWMSETLYQN